ncbi:MAG: hypothetical protein B6U85_05245 [Desulfurococcales archaeon ex4484_42]|nr:MAG: hypothetical protein B6U85_05245 [Desulfurococcales archaeon ex4484_42]
MKLNKLVRILMILVYVAKIILSALILYLNIKVSTYFRSIIEKYKFKRTLRKYELPEDVISELYNIYSRSLSKFSISLKDFSKIFRVSYRYHEA